MTHDVTQKRSEEQVKDGPTTEPCGTPQVKEQLEELLPTIHTTWVRLQRYDSNQAEAFPRPKHADLGGW